jgi:hypothetical protein
LALAGAAVVVGACAVATPDRSTGALTSRGESGANGRLSRIGASLGLSPGLRRAQARRKAAARVMRLSDDRKRKEAKRTSDDLTEKIQSAAEIKAELERVVDELSKSSQGDGVRKLVEEAIGRVKSSGKSSSKDQTTSFELPRSAPRRAHRARQRDRVAERAAQRRAQRTRARRSVVARQRAELAQAKRAGSYHKALEQVGEKRMSELKEESAALIKRIEEAISNRVEEIQTEADKEGTEDAKREAKASIQRLQEEGAARVQLVKSKTASRIQLLEQAMSPSASLGQGEESKSNDDDDKKEHDHGDADETSEQRAAREAREAEAAQRHLDALRQRQDEEEREMLQANDELAEERREARKEIASAALEEEREAREEQRAAEQKAEREAQDKKDAEIALKQAQAQADRAREHATAANESVQESKEEVDGAEAKLTAEQHQADEAAKKLEEEKREAEREIIESKRKEEQEARQEQRTAEREVEREREDAENFRQQVEVAKREAETARMQAKRAEEAEQRAAEERAETERKAEERREKHEEEHELEVAERKAETEEEQRHRQAMRDIEAGRLDEVEVSSSSKRDENDKNDDDDDDKNDDDDDDKYNSDLLKKIDESMKAMEHKFDSLDDEMKGIENKMNQYPASQDSDENQYPASQDSDDDKYPVEEQYDDSYTTLPDDQDEGDFDEDAEDRAEMLQERVEELLRQLEAAQAKNTDDGYPNNNDGYSTRRYFDEDFFRRRPIGLEPDFETTDPSQESGLMYACPSRNTCMSGASLFVRNNQLLGMRGECEDGSSATDLRSNSFSLFPEFTNIDPTVDSACSVQFGEDSRSVWIRREDDYVIAMSSDGTASTRCGRDVAAAASVRYECQNPLACITGFHIKNEYGNLDHHKARTPNDLAISEVDFVCSDGNFAVDPNTLRRDYGQVRVDPFFETGVAETPQEDGSTRRTLTPFLKLKTDTVVSSSFLMAIRVRDSTDLSAAEQEGWCNQQTEQAHLNAFHTCRKGSKLCAKAKFLYNPDGSEYELKMGEQIFSVLDMASHESSRVVIGNEDMTDGHHVKSFPIAPNEEFFKFGRKYQVCASAVERTKFKTQVKDKTTGAVTDTFFNRHLDGSAKFIGLRNSGERSISMEGGPRHFDVATPAAPSEDEVASLHCFGCAVSGGVHINNNAAKPETAKQSPSSSSYPNKQYPKQQQQQQQQQQQYPKQQQQQYPKQQQQQYPKQPDSPLYPQQATTVEEKLQNMVIKKDSLPKYPTTEQQQYPQQQRANHPAQQQQQRANYPVQQQQQQANYPAQQQQQQNYYPAQEQQQQNNYPAQQQQQQPDESDASLAKEAKEEELTSLRQRLKAMLHRH